MDDQTQSYTARENLWDEQWPEDNQGSSHGADTDGDDELTGFPGAVGTADSMQAIRDAEPYDPPTDPPVLPGGPDGIHVATGFGTSAQEETADDDPSNDDDVRQDVVFVLENDSLLSKYPLHAAVVDGIVRLTGRIPSADDAEYAQSVVANVPGVVDVMDDTTLESAVE